MSFFSVGRAGGSSPSPLTHLHDDPFKSYGSSKDDAVATQGGEIYGKESFVLVVLNRENEESSEQIIQEFSHPVDTESVEDWCDLYDIWFHEIETVHLDEANWGSTKAHKVNVFKRLKGEDLEKNHCYLVCGYTFDENFKTTDIHRGGIPAEKLETFRKIARCSQQDCVFYLDSCDFDLTDSLMRYYAHFPLIPHESLHVGEPRSKKAAFLGEILKTYSGEMSHQQRKDFQDKIGELDGGGGVDLAVDLTKRETSKEKLSILLLVAARLGQIERLKTLLEEEGFIDPCIEDDRGRHVLHHCGVIGIKQMIQYLLEREDILTLIAKPDKKGITPLRYAVINNSYDVVCELLRVMDAKRMRIQHNTELECLLNIAVEKDNIPMLKRLLKVEGIPFVAKKGVPPVIGAAKAQSLDGLKLILQARPQCVNYISQDTGFTKNSALHMAIVGTKTEFYKLRMVNVLLDYGANINYQDREGKTALFIAIMHGYEEIAQLILKKRPNLALTTFGDDPTSLLELAMVRQMSEVTNLMIQQGAKMTGEGAGARHYSPLLFCVNKGRITLLRDLVKLPNIDINEQSTVLELGGLHIALQNRYPTCAKILIEQGIDPNLRDYMGRTAAHIAKINREDDIMKKLENCGHDMHALDMDGVSVKNYQWKSAIARGVRFNEVRSVHRAATRRENDVHYVTQRFTVVTRRDNLVGLCEEQLMPLKSAESVRQSVYEWRKLRATIPDVFLDGMKSILLPELVEISEKGFDVVYANPDYAMGTFEDTMCTDPHVLFCPNDHFVERMDRLHQLICLLTILHRQGHAHGNIRASCVAINQKQHIALLNFSVRCLRERFHIEESPFKKKDESSPKDDSESSDSEDDEESFFTKDINSTSSSPFHSPTPRKKRKKGLKNKKKKSIAESLQSFFGSPKKSKKDTNDFFLPPEVRKYGITENSSLLRNSMTSDPMSGRYCDLFGFSQLFWSLCFGEAWTDESRVKTPEPVKEVTKLVQDCLGSRDAKRMVQQASDFFEPLKNALFGMTDQYVEGMMRERTKYLEGGIGPARLSEKTKFWSERRVEYKKKVKARKKIILHYTKRVSGVNERPMLFSYNAGQVESQIQGKKKGKGLRGNDKFGLFGACGVKIGEKRRKGMSAQQIELEGVLRKARRERRDKVLGHVEGFLKWCLSSGGVEERAKSESKRRMERKWVYEGANALFPLFSHGLRYCVEQESGVKEKKFLFRLLDLLRMCACSHVFCNYLLVREEKVMEILERYVEKFVSKLLDFSTFKKGARLMLLLFYCNVLNSPEGTHYLLDGEAHWKNIEKLVIAGLKIPFSQETVGIQDHAVYLLQNVAIKAHIFKIDMGNILKVIVQFLNEAVVMKKDVIEKMLNSFYIILKFHHPYKKMLKEFMAKNGINFSDIMKKTYMLIQDKELTISLSAMLLKYKPFEKVCDYIKILDPFKAYFMYSSSAPLSPFQNVTSWK